MVSDNWYGTGRLPMLRYRWKTVESCGGTWWTWSHITKESYHCRILPYSATLLLARLLLAPWRLLRYLYEHCLLSPLYFHNRKTASILVHRSINQLTHFIN